MKINQMTEDQKKTFKEARQQVYEIKDYLDGLLKHIIEDVEDDDSQIDEIQGTADVIAEIHNAM